MAVERRKGSLTDSRHRRRHAQAHDPNPEGRSLDRRTRALLRLGYDARESQQACRESRGALASGGSHHDRSYRSGSYPVVWGCCLVPLIRGSGNAVLDQRLTPEP